MNRIDCLSSLHSRFLASCFSIKSFSLTKILRSLQASSLVAIRFLYWAWISFSSKLSGGTVRSRSSIPYFANSHLLFSAIRSRLHCALISFSFGGVNTVTAPPCLIHAVDAFWASSLEPCRLPQDVNASIANRRIDPLIVAMLCIVLWLVNRVYCWEAKFKWSWYFITVSVHAFCGFWVAFNDSFYSAVGLFFSPL